MISSSSQRTKVFISYSHKDVRYLDELLEHLAYYERLNLIDSWSDKRITSGAQWREEIKQAIDATKVAVLFISRSFLASKFIAENELPPLLDAAKNKGAIILPVIVRPSNFDDTELANFQAVNLPSMPLAKMNPYQRDILWVEVVRDIKKALVLQPLGSTTIGNQQITPNVITHTTLESSDSNAHTGQNSLHPYEHESTAPNSKKTEMNSWQEIVTVPLREFVLLWTFVYGKNNEKLIDPFVTELQTKLILVCNELITFLSRSSRAVPKEVISNIGSIAARLETLGRMQFFLDGGLSIIKFNELGDNIIKDAENLIEKLNSEGSAELIEDEGTASDKQFDYDVALSYAGEDREYAASLANILKSHNVKVFFDLYEKPYLWGKDLYIHLSDLYQNKARYCVIFLSKHYVKKLWSKHGLKAAQVRALNENKEYILPIRLDTSEIPDILSTIAYLNWHEVTPESVAEALLEKLESELDAVRAQISQNHRRLRLIELKMAQYVDPRSVPIDLEYTRKMLLEENSYLLSRLKETQNSQNI